MLSQRQEYLKVSLLIRISLSFILIVRIMRIPYLSISINNAVSSVVSIMN